MTTKDSLIQSDSSSFLKDTQKTNQKGFFVLMEKVGTMGRYQVITFLIWCLMVYMAGGLTLMVPFLFYQDPYTCDPSLTEKACLDYVCSLPSQDRHIYIPSEAFYSLSNKFGNYRCQPQHSQLTLVITIMYAGALLGVFFMSLAGDLLSRKTLILVNLVMMMLGMLLTIFCANLWMAGIGICLCVFGGKNNFNLTVIFMTQTSARQYRQTFSVLIHTSYCLGGLANVLWYYVIGNFLIVLIVCYAIPSLVVLGGLIFYAKDTPICLMSKYSPQQAHSSLKFISEANRKQQFYLTVEDVKEHQESYKKEMQRQQKQQLKARKFSMLDLFRYRSLRLLTIVLVVMDCTLDLEYYAPTLMLDQFKFNIFVNGLVIQSSLIIACLITTFIVNRFPRRAFNSFAYAIITCCALVLIFIWDQNKQQVTDLWSNVAVLALIFLNQFMVIAQFNFFLVYINELFPTQVRIIGIGFIKIFGGLSQTLAAPLISLCLRTKFRIMIIFGALALVCTFCTWLLPETFEKLPAQMIEQLKQENIEKDEETTLQY